MSVSVANYKVELNGSPLPDEWSLAIEAVSVEDEINWPAMFNIQVNIVNFKDGKWRGLDLKVFKPGDKVKVYLGLDRAELMVSGEITSLELNLGEHSVMEIRGYDLLHRLRMGTRNKLFTKKKDSDIASEIAGDHGLSGEVDDTGTVYPSLFQNNQSDYDFLLERAALQDYEIYVEDKKLYYVKSRAVKSPNLPDLTFKKDFESLNLEMRSLTRGSQVTIRGWDVKEKAELQGDGAAGDETTKMGGQKTGYEWTASGIEESPIAIAAEHLIDANEAKTMAVAAYNSRLRDFVTGEGMCWGNPQLRAGRTVKLLGMDERFSGIYYIYASIHRVDSKGYTTIFKVKRTSL